jgi:hypothetical protein
MSNDFTDILIKKLSRVPDAADLVIIIDSKSLLAKSNQLVSKDNKLWNIYHYNGNDLELRTRWNKAKQKHEKLLIHCVPKTEYGSISYSIVLSFIGDIVASAR